MTRVLPCGNVYYQTVGQDKARLSYFAGQRSLIRPENELYLGLLRACGTLTGLLMILSADQICCANGNPNA